MNPFLGGLNKQTFSLSVVQEIGRGKMEESQLKLLQIAREQSLRGM